MTSKVLSGTPQEVAAEIARLGDPHIEAIVLSSANNGNDKAKIGPTEDIFAETVAFTAHAPNADDSREAIYTRKPGE